jgi:hypothetical protein
VVGIGWNGVERGWGGMGWGRVDGGKGGGVNNREGARCVQEGTRQV